MEGGCTPGEGFAQESCSDTQCPVWAQWGSWGSCSRTCGPGAKERTRPCDGEGECFGRGEEAEECLIVGFRMLSNFNSFLKIQASCTLTTEWSAWSPCTQTCGNGGVKIRSRVESPLAGAKTVSENTPCNEDVSFDFCNFKILKFSDNLPRVVVLGSVERLFENMRRWIKAT